MDKQQTDISIILIDYKQTEQKKMAFFTTTNKKSRIKFTLPSLGKRTSIKPKNGLSLDPTIEMYKTLNEQASKHFIFRRL